MTKETSGCSGKGNRSEYYSSLPFPYPYLISVIDKYYGISPSHEEKQTMKNTQTHSYVHRTGTKQKENMRILLTTFWDYPFVGGLQNYLTALKGGLEELGHCVDIIAPNHFPERAFKKNRRKAVEQSEQFFLGRYGCYSEQIVLNTQSLFSYEMMLRDMDLEKYDIFHAQDRFTANVLGRLKPFYQKPLLFTPHGFMTHRKVKNHLIAKGSVEEAYYFQIDRKAIEDANQVIILCEAFRSFLTQLGADDNKMTTVYTGIPFKAVPKNRQADGRQDKVVVTCVTRLGPRKGHKYLFEALSLIRDELTHVEVRIVGDGEMREELEKQVQVLRLTNVQFLGSRSDIPELLSESDIYVLPTVSDTLPISIIEAMFAEQAVLTTDVGGIPELIQDQRTGFITKPGDPEQLAEKLLLLLHDRTLRETLARSAKQYAETHFNVETMAKKIEEVYLSLL